MVFNAQSLNRQATEAGGLQAGLHSKIFFQSNQSRKQIIMVQGTKRMTF